MSNLEEQFKINLNQNLWGLVIGFISLGVSEHYNLCTLFWCSIVVSVDVDEALGMVEAA